MNRETVSDSDFENAYRISAMIVQKFGDKYLPIFERMHKEKSKRQSDNELMKLALQVARLVE